MNTTFCVLKDKVKANSMDPAPLRKNNDIDLMKSRLSQLIKEKAFLTSAKTGRQFKLSSGEFSDFYFDVKKVTADPEGIYIIANVIFDLIKDEPLSFIGGMESGAIPIATAVSSLSYQLGKTIPCFWVRVKPKEHGTMSKIEGNLERNSTVIIVDDVTTKGRSVEEAIKAVKDEGCHILKVITLIDRQEGAQEKFKKLDIEFIPIFKKKLNEDELEG